MSIYELTGCFLGLITLLITALLESERLLLLILFSFVFFSSLARLSEEQEFQLNPSYFFYSPRIPSNSPDIHEISQQALQPGVILS